MSATHLNQTLIVDPNTTFAEIEKVVRELGLGAGETNLATEPLIPGEPEIATWSFNGRKPRIVYSLNPVAMLRVLDVSTLPPAMRTYLANNLRLLNDEDIEDLFKSTDARDRLRGLWAAQECQLLDFAPLVASLGTDSEEVVASQSRLVLKNCKEFNQRRLQHWVN